MSGTGIASGADAIVRRPRKRNVKRGLTVLLFMSPWILGFLLLILYPMVSSLYFSFTKYSLLEQPVWIGTENYTFMFTKDPFFWLAFRNTIWIIIVGVPLRIAFGDLHGMAAHAASVGIADVSDAVLPADDGPSRGGGARVRAGLQPVVRARQPDPDAPRRRRTPVVVLRPQLVQVGARACSGLWGVGDAMIIFLAGLLDVPRQLYEAAEIEGANGRQKFRFVTLPMISPVIFFSLVIGVIYGFQLFTQAYVASLATSGSSVTEAAANLGAPQGSMLFYAIYLYQQGFQDFRMGYASAHGVGAVRDHDDLHASRS